MTFVAVIKITARCRNSCCEKNILLLIVLCARERVCVQSSEARTFKVNTWFDRISSGVLVVPIKETIGKKFSHHTRSLFIRETRGFIFGTTDNINTFLPENIWLLLQTHTLTRAHGAPTDICTWILFIRTNKKLLSLVVSCKHIIPYLVPKMNIITPIINHLVHTRVL